MEDLMDAVANAETALSDLRLAIHRHRKEEGAQQVSAWMLPAYDMVCDMLNNLEEGRPPFEGVTA